MVKIVKKIVRKGYPTSSTEYREAHSEASEDEKRKFPKGYAKLKKMDKRAKPGELLGTHSKSDKVEIERKVPKGLRKEVAFHERTEFKADKRLKREKK